MTKLRFLDELHRRLETLSEGDLDKTLEFYAEMIDDHMEEGRTEAEAVAAAGDPAEIARQILGEAAGIGRKEDLPANAGRQSVRGRSARRLLLRARAVILRILHLLPLLPIWACAVVLTAAFAACAIFGTAGVIGGEWNLVSGEPVIGVFSIAVSLVLIGGAVFLFLGMRRYFRYAYDATGRIAARAAVVRGEKEDTEDGESEAKRRDAE